MRKSNQFISVETKEEFEMSAEKVNILKSL